MLATFTKHRTYFLKFTIYIYLQKTMFTLPHFRVSIRSFRHKTVALSAAKSLQNHRGERVKIFWGSGSNKKIFFIAPDPPTMFTHLHSSISSPAIPRVIASFQVMIAKNPPKSPSVSTSKDHHWLTYLWYSPSLSLFPAIPHPT